MSRIKDRDRWGYKYTERIFEYLKPVAARCETVFYSDVERDVGGNARSLGGRELTAIQKECDKHRWPHLNVLVVAKKGRLPGDAYRPFGHRVTRTEFDKLQKEVCVFSWTDKYL